MHSTMKGVGMLALSGLLLSNVALAAPFMNPEAVVLESATQQFSSVNLDLVNPFNTYQVTFRNTSSETQNVVLDVELYSMLGRINQLYERHTLMPNEPMTVTLHMNFPQHFPSGTYRLKAGIFTENWGSLVRWHDEVLSTEVTGGTSAATRGTVSLQSSSIDKVKMHEGENQVTGVATFMAESPNGEVVPVIIDSEVYKDGVRVHQTFWGADVTPGVPFVKQDLLASGNLSPGRYVWKLGIFRLDWSGPVQWYDHVRSFDVLPAGSDLGAPESDVYLDSAEFAPEVGVGAQNAVTLALKSQGSNPNDVTLDLELYNEHGVRVYQEFEENIDVAGNAVVTKEFRTPGLSAGTYKVRVGIFDAGWTSLMHWYHDVGTFVVR